MLPRVLFFCFEVNGWLVCKTYWRPWQDFGSVYKKGLFFLQSLGRRVDNSQENPPISSTMRKADVAMTLKKGADEAAAPPSPILPPKRSKTGAEQVVPESRGPGLPNPSHPVFIRKMRNAAVGTGCDIRLKVTVAGDPQPSLYWYHNDELLNMENQEYGGLWIRDCKPSDAGLYTCIANNHLGEARTSAVLAVLDLGEGNGSVCLDIRRAPCSMVQTKPVNQFLCSSSPL